MDRPLEVHRLALGEDVVAWWRAGVLFADRDRYVQWYGRLVLTTTRLLFEPDRVGDDAHPDGPSFRPTEVAYDVPLTAIGGVDPVPGDRPPRVRFMLVDGRELVFVVTRQSGVVTQWTRDTGERDRSVDVVRRVLAEVGADPSAATGAPVAGSAAPLVPAALAARAEDRSHHRRVPARRRAGRLVRAGRLPLRDGRAPVHRRRHRARRSRGAVPERVGRPRRPVLTTESVKATGDDRCDRTPHPSGR